jgi:hypothetical protein
MEIVCDARTLFSTGTCRQRARFLGTWENVLKTVCTSLFVRVLTAISVPKQAQAAGENGRMACFASQSDRPISTEKIETTCEYWKESRSRAAYSGKHLRRNFPPDSNPRHKLHDSGCGPSSAWLGETGDFRRLITFIILNLRLWRNASSASLAIIVSEDRARSQI